MNELSERDIVELCALEEALWRTETRFDPDFMERVLAADFFEFGRSGRIYQREDTLGIAPEPIDAHIRNFAARLLAPNVAQLTYDSYVVYDGVVTKGHRSSIWTRHNDEWQLRFHQGTPFD